MTAAPDDERGGRVERFLDEAVGHYHLVLEKRHAEHAEVLHTLLDAGVTYGGRALCPFLRPHFVTRSQLTHVERVCRGFKGAMSKAKDAVLADPALGDWIGLTDGERRLVALDPGFRSAGVTTRLDTFLTGYDIRFIELNADSPAGLHYSDTMARVFRSLGAMQEFTQRYGVTALGAADELVATLRGVWQEWGGAGTPRVAVVDWQEVATRTEFELVCRHLGSHGIPARFVDPRELEFTRGVLAARGEPIDLVYRRLLVNELLPREDECRALLDAVAARAVCMFNSFRAKILTKKLTFALLQDPRVAAAFTPEEAQIVRACVPWTRRVAEGRTTGPDGAEVDLVEYVRTHREGLVLKPNDEYGGRGVVIGWNVERAMWEGALQIALSDPSIVQERVHLPRRLFPVLENGTFALSERYIDLDPYLFRGVLGGLLTRLSASSLCNVTAGGGSVPTFVLEGA